MPVFDDVLAQFPGGQAPAPPDQDPGVLGSAAANVGNTVLFGLGPTVGGAGRYIRQGGAPGSFDEGYAKTEDLLRRADEFHPDVSTGAKIGAIAVPGGAIVKLAPRAALWGLGKMFPGAKRLIDAIEGGGILNRVLKQAPAPGRARAAPSRLSLQRELRMRERDAARQEDLMYRRAERAAQVNARETQRTVRDTTQRSQFERREATRPQREDLALRRGEVSLRRGELALERELRRAEGGGRRAPRASNELPPQPSEPPATPSTPPTNTGGPWSRPQVSEIPYKEWGRPTVTEVVKGVATRGKLSKPDYMKRYGPESNPARRARDYQNYYDITGGWE